MNYRGLITAALLFGLPSPLPAQSVKSGIAAWKRSEYASAVKIWRPLAQKGDADAQFNLAQAYRFGRGVPIDLAAALSWLERAANQGHVDAQTTLGLLLFQSGNHTGAIRWLQSAADKHNPRAMLVLGTALFNGDGVSKDAALGYSYASRAAAAGLGTAKATLATMDQLISADDRKKAAALIAATEPVDSPKNADVPASKPPPRNPKPTLAAPAPDRRAAPRPAAAPTSGGWRIQLGAFSQRSKAEALFRKLSTSSAISGRSATYSPAGAVTRLQVGPFESRAAAADACRALAARGQACFPVAAK